LKPEGRVAPTMEKLLHSQPGRPLAVAVAVAVAGSSGLRCPRSDRPALFPCDWIHHNVAHPGAYKAKDR